MFEIVKPKILSIRKIPFINNELAIQFDLPKEHNSIGIITSDQEHSLIVALDEGVKESPSNVLFYTNFYSGHKFASGPFSGEVIGIFSAEDPIIIDNSIKATVNYLNEKTFYYSFNGLNIFSHVVSSIGNFLSRETNLQEGEAIAYLMAPPLEAIISVDFALKNSDTKLVKYFKPPTKTNYSGAYLTGSLSNCIAASESFIEKVKEIYNNPI